LQKPEVFQEDEDEDDEEEGDEEEVPVRKHLHANTHALLSSMLFSQQLDIPCSSLHVCQC
jgi:hypothetical protein